MIKAKTKYYGHILIILVFTALMLGSCASAPKSSSEAVYEEAGGSFEAMPAEAPVEMEFQEEDSAFSKSTTDDVERLVIKNASISIVVEDPATTLESVSQMAEDLGGFVVNANLYQRELESGNTVTQASATIRVPAEKLNRALGLLRAYSDQDPINESIDSQDVTREYVDQKSRLRNLEKTEDQLLEIMEDANRTEDVLAVYSELARVREEIEVTKGQIQYFEQSAAFSLINIDMLPDEAVQPLTIGGWEPVGVAKNAVQALINALKFIVDAIIWVVIFLLPVLLALAIVFGLPIYLIIRAGRRRRRKSSRGEDSKPAEETETK